MSRSLRRLHHVLIYVLNCYYCGTNILLSHSHQAYVSYIMITITWLFLCYVIGIVGSRLVISGKTRVFAVFSLLIGSLVRVSCDS